MGAFLRYVPGASSALRDAICPGRAVLRVTPKCKCLTEKCKYFKPFIGAQSYQHPCQQMEQSSTSLQSVHRKKSRRIPLPSQAPSVRGRCDGWDWRHLSVAFTPVLSRRRRQQACLGSGAERRQPSHPSARGERSGASPSPGRGSEPGTNVACVVGRAASRGSREQNTDLTHSSAESPECIKQSPAARVARKGRHEASGLSGRYVRAAAA